MIIIYLSFDETIYKGAFSDTAVPKKDYLCLPWVYFDLLVRHTTAIEFWGVHYKFIGC